MRILPSLMCVVWLVIPTLAQEWPSWRGPTADGVAAKTARPPIRWSAEENLVWKTALEGLGASSPVIAGDLIFITTAVPIDGVVDHKDKKAPVPEHRFLVLAYRRSDGALAWKVEVARGVPHEKGHVTGTFASASVVTDGKHVCAFFGSVGLFCLDTKGKLLWQRDLGQQKTLVAFGEGASPALHDGVLVVPWDHEETSFVVGLDVATGKQRWRQERATDSSWGTPLVIPAFEAWGKSQVVLTGSDVTHAYDLDTGAPVWHCKGMSKNPVNTATFGSGHVFVQNSYKGNITQAIRLAGATGDVTKTHVSWSTRKNASYVPASVHHDGLLYFLRNSTGVLSCLDARTGKVHYSAKKLGIRKIHASPILANGHLYFAGRDGQVAVVKAGPKFEQVATNALDDVFDATPAAVGTNLYLRGQRFLYCFGGE